MRKGNLLPHRLWLSGGVIDDGQDPIRPIRNQSAIPESLDPQLGLFPD
jgi:hypothetical protein